MAAPTWSNSVKSNPTPYVIGAVVLFIGGRWLYKQLVPDKAGDGKNWGSNVPEIPQKKLTYPKWQYATTADALYAAFWTNWGFTEDEEAVKRLLLTMQTDNDVTELIRVYGERGPGTLFDVPITLPMSVSNYMDADFVTDLNNAYARKGIQYRW